GGRVDIEVQGAVTIAGVGKSPSAIFTNLAPGAKGQAGNINIRSGSFSLTDGARLVSSTSGQGDAGNISIQTSGAVELDGNSFIFNNVEAGGEGDAGLISIKADSLSITNGAQVQSLVRQAQNGQNAGQGNGGRVDIDVQGAVIIAGQLGNFSSAIFTDLLLGTRGKAGDINIRSGSLSVKDGAEISSSTFGEGDAGNISIQTSGAVELSDLAVIFNDVEAEGVGNAGSISINADSFSLTNGAQVVVSSTGTGKAGNIEIIANRVLLDNQGKLLAEATSVEGGNIILQVEDWLLMRHNSLISAEAGNKANPGNGGNITINAGFVIAVPSENSDIIADAFLGNGGNINITTQGIFGLEFRPKRTPKSDITASSQFGLSGTVNITQLNIDPTQGLSELPIDTVAPQLDQTCSPTGSGRNEFTVTGRDGLPPSPTDMLSSQRAMADLGTPVNSIQQTRGHGDAGTGRREIPSQNSFTSPTTNPTSSSQPLVEAKGWIIDEQGNVTLTAYVPTANTQETWQPQPSCQRDNAPKRR
ncbi:MAG: S-layer family protein, partial [Symploca sp. SIO3E6]|nr:S-layer family protein [Caldora sp. SIO3E6]